VCHRGSTFEGGLPPQRRRDAEKDAEDKENKNTKAGEHAEEAEPSSCAIAVRLLYEKNPDSGSRSRYLCSLSVLSIVVCFIFLILCVFLRASASLR
jgi:hypothetical protein